MRRGTYRQISKNFKSLGFGLLIGAGLVFASPLQGYAQDVSADYDRKLQRLAEILGAVHHLRDVCGAKEGQMWRDQMIKLLNAESPSPSKRARLVKSFNQGFRGYKRTYRRCNPAASLAINRFISEGAQLAQSMARERLN